MNDQYIKPIETVYKGYRFRSRLEARWAVFFDATGVEWEYEKEGYELRGGIRYLPDFFLYVDKKHAPTWGTFIEIKAVEPTEDEREKLLLLHEGSGNEVACFWGKPSEDDWNVTTFDSGHNHIKNGLYCRSDVEKYHLFMDRSSTINGTNISFLPLGYLWHLLPFDNKSYIISNAFVKAKQARFEYGEAG